MSPEEMASMGGEGSEAAVSAEANSEGLSRLSFLLG